MMIKVPKSEDIRSVEAFLKENLRKNANWSLAEEYPLAFDPKNRTNLRIAVNTAGDVLSHAALKTVVLKASTHLLKVGVIGSVCTSPDHRGQGLAKGVIEGCLESATLQGCDVGILWSDLIPFYEKMGFEPAGTEVHLTIPDKLVPKVSLARRICKTSNVSPQAILNLYNKHSLRSFRSVSEVSKSLHIPNSEVFTSWSLSTGQMEAYAVVGKGADFQNYIHEWGGSVSSIIDMITKIRPERSQLSMIAPKTCENLIRQMEALGAKKSMGTLGLIKILNPQSFCKRIRRGARSMGYDNFVLEHENSVTTFGVGTDLYQSHNLQDLIRLAFGPIPPEKLHNFSNQTLDTLNEIFPMPFWIWGWDSI